MEKEVQNATRSTATAPAASSGNDDWDEKVHNKNLDQSHSSNFASSKYPFDTPTEKIVVNTNHSDDLESGQENSSIQEESAEDANIVSWDGQSDPENPMNWPSWRR
jgi:hypothetical protein